ncbi:MAG: RNase adapter RapZ [Lachnospiraceae bacterium]|nr:RNase adapter RapZ [Lachnospiraceae bacterium]
MRLVIVTGMSGSGKNEALKFFEDNGYYCVDNLPIPLILTFAEFLTQKADQSEVSNFALSVDIRSGHLDEMEDVLAGLEEKGFPYEILFLETDDSTLIRRYKETRRNHPMNEKKSIIHGINKEREELAFLKEKADCIIDTSNLLVRDLRMELEKIFIQNKDYKNLFITILSFGFKHGIPSDCDLVFDVRFLPNPYYESDLRDKTGNDAEVRDFVLNSEVTTTFIDKLCDMMKFLIPNYIKEGKNQLVIGIGCTGGHHRSVTIARKLFEELEKCDEYGLKLSHRDINR